ncbi:MAG: acetyl-CoA carboxylase biotin carboxylase subunit [Ostreibacterium sp.]
MNKVLIANRGEIACRIIKSCQKLGIKTVAVYSEADENSLHKSLADEAICVGPAKSTESYLNVPAVLKAAKDTGATAIHPGYGFLAENTDFADSIVAQGMKWIGPAPETILLMGDKDRARTIAQEAGVPVLTGSPRFEMGALENIENYANKVGYPLLVKASAGGGGIGIKLVRDEKDLLKVAQSTQALALRSFGDGAIFLERYVQRARHIEVQVFGDGKGNAIHLFERDCSIQRRFQKVLEESPAPHLTGDLRDEIVKSAVNLAKAQNYAGAGTVEFIFDDDTKDYYFLEMNTRIQVEHPVTEMVTDMDLVAMQLQVVFDNDFRLDQSVVKHNGVAIECRLYAENPSKMFLPSPGTLTTLKFPVESKNIRIDTGFREGDKVTPYYDPMISKVITWGKTRDEAIAIMISVLSKIKVEGLFTNVTFLLDILKHNKFQQGLVSTRFIKLHAKELNIDGSKL